MKPLRPSSMLTMTVLLLVGTATTTTGTAFQVPAPPTGVTNRGNPQLRIQQASSSSTTTGGGTTSLLAMTSLNNVLSGGEERVGNTIYAGEPTSRAKTLQHRQVLRQHSVYDIQGKKVPFDDILLEFDQKATSSIVVFLRSLGCPLCQEHILQWKKRKKELEESNIQLVLVSIGVPEKAKALRGHLELGDDDVSLYVDPDNVLYDALDLNRGIQRTFFGAPTAFSFLERLKDPNGLQELGYVLSRWSKAIYIPPKQAQALLQGGSFVFYGDDTLYAHYDPSTAAHAKIDRVLEIAKQAASAQQQTANNEQQ